MVSQVDPAKGRGRELSFQPPFLNVTPPKFNITVARLDVREAGHGRGPPRPGRFECIAFSLEKSNFGDPSFRHPERSEVDKKA